MQEVENEKIKTSHAQLMEENSGLRVQSQKLAEEASYAKELASAAAVELKNLAGEVTKLSLQNARQAKELLAAQDMAYSRGSNMHPGAGGIRKHSESKFDGVKLGRKGRLTSKGNESTVYDDVEFWSLDSDDIKMELVARKQREAALEAALAEKELAEEEYRKKFDEAKKREAALENDLAGMWVLVAKLKKGDGATPELNVDERSSHGVDAVGDPKTNTIDNKDVLKESHVSDDMAKPLNDDWNQSTELEPLVVRLKVSIHLISRCMWWFLARFYIFTLVEIRNVFFCPTYFDFAYIHIQ